MAWHIKVTGSGVVAAEGENDQEFAVPQGQYTMTQRPDGRYELIGDAGSYLIVAPEHLSADTYLDQKVQDGTLQIVGGDSWN